MLESDVIRRYTSSVKNKFHCLANIKIKDSFHLNVNQRNICQLNVCPPFHT